MGTFETVAACSRCEATGVYVGMGERDGMAVQCNTCNGTGIEKIRVTWDEFDGKKTRDNVTQVLEVNPGICAAPNVVPGGISYELWQQGLGFPRGAEMRQHTCPAWWFQSADCTRKPDWKQCLGVGAFSDCKQYPDKASCWRRFDEEERS